MNALTLFYDPKCGLCRAFRKWMLGQESYCRLEFVPYTSGLARRLLPEIVNMDAGREIVVMSDEGDIWQGPEAWVVSLWVLKKWRGWAKRMATPALLPLAGKVCHLISANRLTLSKLLTLKADEEVAAFCDGSVPCGGGVCGVEQATGKEER
jgi:predicted DCC family thiol-disulfide oxidoreductase YuxK